MYYKLDFAERGLQGYYFQRIKTDPKGLSFQSVTETGEPKEFSIQIKNTFKEEVFYPNLNVHSGAVAFPVKNLPIPAGFAKDSKLLLLVKKEKDKLVFIDLQSLRRFYLADSLFQEYPDSAYSVLFINNSEET